MSKAKKILASILVIASLIFVIVFVYNYFNSGTLVVEVKQPDSTIVVVDSKGNEVLKEQSQTLSKKLPKGVYEVSASNQKGGVSSTDVEISSRQEKKVVFDINEISVSATLVDLPASNIFRSTDGLYFIQTNSKALKQYKFDSASMLGTSLNVGPLSKAELNKKGNGYVLTANELIYSVVGKKSANIREGILSEVEVLDKPRDIEYSKDSKDLFVSAGNKVYRSEYSKKAKLIYKADWPINHISYSENGWLFLSELVVEKEEVEEGGFEDPSKDAETVSMILLNTDSGERLDLGKTYYEQGASWSADGKFLTYRDVRRAFVYSLDDKKIVSKVLLSKNSTYHSTWCPDNTLVFSDSFGVWKYSIGDNYKSLVSKLKNVRSLYCGSDGLFVGTFEHPRDGGLYKLPDSGVNDKLYESLNRALPYIGNGFNIYYAVSNNKPVVRIDILVPRDISYKKKGDSGFLAHNIYINNKRTEAKNFLKSIGVDKNNSKIVFEELST